MTAVMEMVYINCESNSAKERSGWLQLVTLNSGMDVRYIDSAMGHELVGLDMSSEIKGPIGFKVMALFSGLLEAKTSIKGYDFYLIDEPKDLNFENRTLTSVQEGQAISAFYLLCSREVKPRQIIVVTDQPDLLASIINEPPSGSTLEMLVTRTKKTYQNHPSFDLNKIRIMQAPQQAEDFPAELDEFINGKKEVQAAEPVTIDLVPVGPRLTLSNQPSLAAKYSDPGKPYMQIVHLNTTAMAGILRNTTLEIDFGKQNIRTIDEPGSEVLIGDHDIVLVDEPKYKLNDLGGRIRLPEKELLHLVFSIELLRTGIDASRVGIIVTKDDLVEQAIKDFAVFKSLFDQDEGFSQESAEGLIKAPRYTEEELLRFHKLLQSAHIIESGNENAIDDISSQVEKVFAEKLNFAPPDRDRTINPLHQIFGKDRQSAGREKM